MQKRERKKKVSEQTTKIIPRSNAGKIFRRAFITGYLATVAVAGIFTVNYACNEPKKVEIDKDTKKGEKNGKKEREFKKPKKLSEVEKKELNKELLGAALKGDVEEVERLLHTGADIETKTSLGWTPLMMAAGDIYTDEVAKLLVKEGADVNASNDDGLTVLMIAAMNGRIGNIKLFVNNGANVHAEDKRGETALDKAKRAGMMKTVELLKSY